MVHVTAGGGRRHRMRGQRSGNEESTRSYFLLLENLVRHWGIPLTLYTDRHSVFTPRDGKSQKSSGITQFTRAMDELGIQLILARSPQAKGRVERMAGTFQDRLVTELRLAGASTITEGNRVLHDFLPRFNEQFRVPAREPEAAYRLLNRQIHLDRVFCFKHQRKVGRDNTRSTSGTRCNSLPTGSAPATPEQEWRCSKGWTAACECNTTGTSSRRRRRHRGLGSSEGPKAISPMLTFRVLSR